MRRRAALLLPLLAGAPALAGGGPENVLVIADPTSPDALRLTNRYLAVRGVPASNVLYMDPDSPDYAAFAALNLPALLGEVSARALEDHADYVLIMPDTDYRMPAPGLVSDVCVGPIQNFSMTAAYTSAFVSDEILAGGLSRTWPNRYAAGAGDPVAFDSETLYASGQPSQSASARRYHLAFMLGYTGERGNSVDELLALIDRSAAADGSFPGGTFYLMNNTADPARNVRSTQYANAETRIEEAGGAAEILGGALPLGRHDCLGVMSGFANENPFQADLTLVPGAFCDHLTSFAATFGAGQQSKISLWIRKGASGSHGTVEEPCNQVGKFPRASIHATYRAGLSLGEATFRSLFYYPFQGLLYGDPLTRPWSHIPVVTVPELVDVPVFGLVVLSPMATTTHPTAGIASFDLLVNDVLVASTTPGNAFMLDTTELYEGHNRVHVIAYEDTPIRTVGSLADHLIVDNLPHGGSVSVTRGTGDLATLFNFEVTASGAPVAEVRLLHNGRVVAASEGAGTLSVHGRLLGADEATLTVEVEFTDGVVFRAAPVTLEIDPVGAPDASAPASFGYTRRIAAGSTRVIELPTTFTDELAEAVWSVTTPPAQATILGGSGPYRVVRFNADAAGADQLSFRVTTPSGMSPVSTINLVYDALPACPADLAEPFGTLDFSDVLAFLLAFSEMDPAADLAAPAGVFDFSDVIEFLVVFGGGCP